MAAPCLSADLDHADRQIRTAEFLVEKGRAREAAELAREIAKDPCLMPDQRLRLVSVALAVVVALSPREHQSGSLPGSFVPTDDASLAVC